MNVERSPREILLMLRRRSGLIAASALLAVLVASVVAMVLPKAYRASTTIEVRGVGALEGREYAQKVNAVTEQVLNWRSFDAVVTKLRLDAAFAAMPESERSEQRQALLQELRDATAVELEQPGGNLSYVTIAHRSADPERCVSVVTELENGYERLVYDQPLEEQGNVLLQREREEHEAKAELDRIAAEKLAFEQENSEFLSDADERLVDVKRQIRELQDVTIASLEVQKKSILESLSGEPPMLVEEVKEKDQVRLVAIDTRIRDIQEKLERLTEIEKKTDEHPDVKAYRKILRSLQDERAELLRDGTVRRIERPNPMYESLQAELRKIDAQLLVATRTLGFLRKQEADLAEQASKKPEVTAQHEKLKQDEVRARALHTARSDELTKVRNHLDTLRNQRHLIINVTNPPVPPRSPAGPGALVIALAGLVAGAGVGAGLAYALHVLDHSFREVDVVSEFLGVPTMGAIHLIQTPPEAAVRRARRRRGVAMLGILAVIAGGTLALALVGNVDAVRELVRSVVG